MEERPPTYIPIILHPLIRLAYVTPDIKAKIQSLGVELITDSSGYYAIHFVDLPGPELKNIPLIEILLKLNQLGVIFGEDYKQLCSPADLMRDLQKEGILRTPFKSIAFGIKKFGDWIIKDNFPNHPLDSIR